MNPEKNIALKDFYFVQDTDLERTEMKNNSTQSKRIHTLLIGIALVLIYSASVLAETAIRVGWATRDITPRKPALLAGQYYKRITQRVRDPLTITVLAIESDARKGKAEQAILVSMDVVNFDPAFQDTVREVIKSKNTDIEVQKIFLNATHTHSNHPLILQSHRYYAGKQGHSDDIEGMDYRYYVLDKIGDAILEAWQTKQPAGVSWGLGHASVGYCRRPVYNDGQAIMYGPTHTTDFIGMEGPADFSQDMLFFWDKNKALTGIVINIPCPTQVTEALYINSSDVWSEVRIGLRKKYGEDLFVLPQIGAGGDVAPRDLPRKHIGEPNMWDVPGLIEAAKRVIRGVESVYPYVRDDIHTTVEFKHAVRTIDLPVKKVSREQYEKAKQIYDHVKQEVQQESGPDFMDFAFQRFLRDVKFNEARRETPPYDCKTCSPFVALRDNGAIMNHYKTYDQNSTRPIEFHAIRLGDIAMANNPFELFLPFGHQIKVKSKAVQTFVVQLSGNMAYLPTIEAVEHGGYGGMIVNGSIGPEGGRKLVQETVATINDMWNE
jgi:hypothetical protein